MRFRRVATVHGRYLLPELSRLESEGSVRRRLHSASGSLKHMAKLYGVSYPTVRDRLDDLIARLEATVEPHENEMAGNAKGEAMLARQP